MIEYKVWYNYILFKLGIRKILPKKIIGRVKINENNEELVKIDDSDFCFGNDIEQPVYIRKKVYEKLCLLNKAVKEDKYEIKLLDAYRSLDKQKELWNETLKETRKLNPGLDEDEIIRITTLKLANPTNGIGGHQTGGAIDITLIDNNGKELDMGSKYLEHIPQTRTYCKDLTNIQRKNRNYLVEKMKDLDFINFPAEWWHYCYGDRM